jgi:hypothetical protein
MLKSLPVLYTNWGQVSIWDLHLRKKGAIIVYMNSYTQGEVP